MHKKNNGSEKNQRGSSDKMDRAGSPGKKLIVNRRIVVLKSNFGFQNYFSHKSRAEPAIALLAD